MLTIAIPTYNRLEFLIKAYESVLNQDSNEYILYIIDDSTNNKTYDYFKKMKLNSNIFYIKNDKNLGIVDNISKSFSIAQTKWITMMTDDDLMDSNFVSESLKVLKNSNKAIVVASFRDINEEGKVLNEYLHKKVILDECDAFVAFCHGRYPTAGGSGFFINTELCKNILKLKNYPNAILSDSYLCSSAATIGGMETINKIIYSRRKWLGGVSSGGHTIWQKMKAIYVSHLAKKNMQKIY